jgi:excinuclease ABC subunit A
VIAPRKVQSFDAECAEWRRLGFFRYVGASGDVLEISSNDKEMGEAAAPLGAFPLLVGRHVLRADDGEILSSLSMAFDAADGELLVVEAGKNLASAGWFRRGLSCNACGRRFTDPVPALFSFNSPRGACETCQGFGRVAGIDPARVVPDPGKSLAERPRRSIRPPTRARTTT